MRKRLRQTMVLPYTGGIRRYAYWDSPCYYWALWKGKPYGRQSEQLSVWLPEVLQDLEWLRAAPLLDTAETKTTLDHSAEPDKNPE